MEFASNTVSSLIPAMAFTLDIYKHTNANYGVNEVLLSSFMAAFIFGFFSCQPLTIVGITGLIDLYAYTTYRIVTTRYNIPFLPFMAWLGIWAAIMHFLIAIFNGVAYIRKITKFSVDIFGFYVGIIYIQYGIRTLVYEIDVSHQNFFFSVALATLFFFTAEGLLIISKSTFFKPQVRRFLADYRLVFCLIFFTGMTYVPGPLKSANLDRLPITRSFFPTQNRSWFVNFWTLDVKYIFVAIPFAFLLTVLFYYDHNVSSLAAQEPKFLLKKPAGFHWDFFLLGISTLLAGFLGLPMPNGLVPQAPLHTEGLIIGEVNENEGNQMKLNRIHNVDDSRSNSITEKDSRKKYNVLEQRVSNLVQGFLILGMMTRPLLVCLGLIRRAILAGIFVKFGFEGALSTNLSSRLLYILREYHKQDRKDPLACIKSKKLYAFVSIQLFGFAITFAISQTIAAIGFSILIFAFIPIRTYILPHWFTEEELEILDEQATNDFTLQGVSI